MKLISNKKFHFLASLLLLLFFLVPHLSFAKESGWAWECDGKNAGDCSFNDLINAVKNVVSKVTILVLEFSIVVFAWIGFLYMKSEGNPGELKRIKKMLFNLVIGIFFIIAAWVIVTTITSVLLDDKINIILK